MRDEEIVEDALNKEQELIGREEKETILAIVNALPTQQRIVFTRKVYEEKKYVEIAEELGISEGTVRTTYSNAWKHVKGMLGKINLSLNENNNRKHTIRHLTDDEKELLGRSANDDHEQPIWRQRNGKWIRDG